MSELKGRNLEMIQEGERKNIKKLENVMKYI